MLPTFNNPLLPTKFTNLFKTNHSDTHLSCQHVLLRSLRGKQSWSKMQLALNSLSLLEEDWD